MEELNLRINDEYQCYTYNELSNKIIDEDDFVSFFSSCYEDNKNFGLLSEYLDKYYNYLCDLIDVSDHFVFETIMEDKKIFRNNLSYEMYYKKIFSEKGYVPMEFELFDISDDKSKKILKENIKFNVGDYERETWIVPIKKKYIINEEYLKGYGVIKFVRNMKQIAELCQQDGYLYDNRPKEEIERHKEKYRKMKL